MESEQFEIILDHYDNPRNHGELEDPQYSHEEGNPICGDIVKLDIKTEDGLIKEAAFTGKGCVISQAASSMLTEAIKGRKLAEIKNLKAEDIFEMLGIRISPIRYKCALLPLKALRTSLFDIKEWPEVNT